MITIILVYVDIRNNLRSMIIKMENIYIVSFYDSISWIHNYATNKKEIEQIIKQKVEEYWNKFISCDIDFRKYYWSAKYEYKRWWDFWRLEYNINKLNKIVLPEQS